MIADEIKKAGQAAIDQSVEELLTYKLTNPQTTFNEDFPQLGALACDTGGSYWYDDNFGEWKITFTQDVCRYNGTPVKTIEYQAHGRGDYVTYEVMDFSDNQLYYDEPSPTFTDFTVRQIEFQNNKQVFQILSSGQPSYTDRHSERESYSEAGLLNTSTVPKKQTCSNIFRRYLTDVAYQEDKTLATINSSSATKMLMINAVHSADYNWSGPSLPNAGGDIYADISNTGSSSTLIGRYANFNYYNPGNLMMILKPNQTAKVHVAANVSSGQKIKVLCTIQEIIL